MTDIADDPRPIGQLPLPATWRLSIASLILPSSRPQTGTSRR